VANLGCIGDWDYGLPTDLKAALTLIEIDAGGGAWTGGGYFQKVGIDRVVSSAPGRQGFRKNTFVGSCSLMRPRGELVRAFGIERYHTLEKELTADAITLPDILKQNQLDHLDFLKTDLEGSDFAVVQSCAAFIDRLLAVQCELRFEPFYEGEPPFHEVAAWLAGRGFELVGLFTEHWKYATPHRFFQGHGRPAYSDCLFFLRPEIWLKWPEEARVLALAKQVIIAAMVGKKNFAEHLLLERGGLLPADWRDSLAALVKPGMPSMPQLLAGLRRAFWPLELKLRYLIGSSRHVATK
jgi:hypothetical protein